MINRMKTMKARLASTTAKLVDAQNLAVKGCKCFEDNAAPDVVTMCLQKQFELQKQSGAHAPARQDIVRVPKPNPMDMDENAPIGPPANEHKIDAFTKAPKAPKKQVVVSAGAKVPDGFVS